MCADAADVAGCSADICVDACEGANGGSEFAEQCFGVCCPAAHASDHDCTWTAPEAADATSDAGETATTTTDDAATADDAATVDDNG